MTETGLLGGQGWADNVTAAIPELDTIVDTVRLQFSDLTTTELKLVELVELGLQQAEEVCNRA